VVFLVVTVYAVSLAARAQGAPNPDQIARFAEETGAWLGPVLAQLFTAWAAWLVARSVASETATRHGLVVGSVVGLIVAAVDLGFGGAFGVGALVGIITVGAGWLGGRLGNVR
jgi:predicted hotdog family 3-hydroxylacyl-ACP dehydratase